MRRQGWIVLGVLLLTFWLGSQFLLPATDGSAHTGTQTPATLPQARQDHAPQSLPDAGAGATRRPASDVPLPAEALATLRRIHAGGPHPYRQDGTVFGNRERLLPQQPRGWYREFTVDTPGLSHRGARRIVTGGDPPREYWYTDDHYRSFTRFDPPVETLR